MGEVPAAATEGYQLAFGIAAGLVLIAIAVAVTVLQGEGGKAEAVARPDRLGPGPGEPALAEAG